MNTFDDGLNWTQARPKGLREKNLSTEIFCIIYQTWASVVQVPDLTTTISTLINKSETP